MDRLQECVDRVVSSGMQAYIGLLSCGERNRARRVLTDTLQISSLMWGGPSALIATANATAAAAATTTAGGREGTIRSVRCIAFFTLRSLLASLLVLRATACWTRVPALEELQHDCALLNRCLAATDRDDGAGWDDGGGVAAVTSRARTAARDSAPR